MSPGARRPTRRQAALEEYEVYPDGAFVIRPPRPATVLALGRPDQPGTQWRLQVDGAGNRSAKASITFTTKPTGWTKLTLRTTVPSGDVTFSGDNADPSGTLIVTIDGTPVPCTCPIAADGTFTGMIPVEDDGTVTGTSVVLDDPAAFYTLAIATADQSPVDHPFQVIP